MNEHYGNIAIVGKPNVGKSTFLNFILKSKISIVSSKPQTTRNQIVGEYIKDNNHLYFFDTPGLHESRNKLDDFMFREIKNSLKMCNCALILIDSTRKIDIEDEKILSLAKKFNFENIVVCLTKCDIYDSKKEENILNEVKKHIEFNKSFSISTSKNYNIDELMSYLLLQATDIYPTYDKKFDDDLLICDTIRESIISNTKQEIPYSVGVKIAHKNYDAKQNLFTIEADIICEKESQKPIIIGKGASMVKKIGIESRQELLKIYNTKINLKLLVKVKKN
jgi:GTP-binding protein Era